MWFEESNYFSSLVQPLSDPRNLISQSAEDLARQDEELDNKISQLHGTQEFRAYFIDHKPGWSLPSVIL